MKFKINLIFLVLNIVLGINIVHGQNIKVYYNHFTLYTADVVDSTFKNVDTTYEVDKNINTIVYRTIETIFKENMKEGKWRRVFCKEKLVGEHWEWESSSIETYNNFGPLTFCCTTLSGTNYIPISNTERVVLPSRKKKKK